LEKREIELRIPALNLRLACTSICTVFIVICRVGEGTKKVALDLSERHL
jgi:hypothetical protein